MADADWGEPEAGLCPGGSGGGSAVPRGGLQGLLKTWLCQPGPRTGLLQATLVSWPAAGRPPLPAGAHP